jgi:transposase-like protein
MKQQRRFTKEFEDEAVRLAATSGRTQREIAGDLGIGLSTLVRWISRDRDRRAGDRPLHRWVLQSGQAPFRAQLHKSSPVRKVGSRLKQCLSTKPKQLHAKAESKISLRALEELRCYIFPLICCLEYFSNSVQGRVEDRGPLFISRSALAGQNAQAAKLSDPANQEVPPPSQQHDRYRLAPAQ